LVFFLLMLGYLGLAARLAYLQIDRHDYYLQKAWSIRHHSFPLLAQRGAIVDRNGQPLAIDIQVGDVIADPTEIADPDATAAVLAPHIPASDASALSARILSARAELTPAGKKIRYVVLAKAVPFAAVRAIQQEAQAERSAHVKDLSKPDTLTGISIETRSVRSYPNGDLAAQVLGFLGQGPAGRMVGEYGVEKSCNTLLAGSDGMYDAETDAQGRILPGTITDQVAARDGQNVTLTIDMGLQRYAQDALAKSVQEHHAQSGTVIVLDPQNGEILADASCPTFDPNNLAKTNYAQWDDRAVSDLYEPGSTMKTLTLSAVLDSEGLDEMNHTIYCDGEMQVGNHIIHCAKDPPTYGHHGTEDMRQVLENSCNIGAAQFALGLGADKLYDYEQAFGLTDKPDYGLPGAEYSRLQSPSDKPWSKIQLANIAFGQGISITPMQLASVYATIAHGGQRVYPHIIKGAVTGPRVQVVKPEVAQAMLSMLQSVVTDGTGEPAQVADYTVGGKTGSAQVAEHGHYGNEYVGSFCGIAPLTNPKLVILCVITKPQGVHWGAVVAAPVVHDIAKYGLWYLKTEPDARGTQDYDDKARKLGKAAFVTIHIPASQGEQTTPASSPAV
jgi:cell division protein FtsI/penicillin-binding protein 2